MGLRIHAPIQYPRDRLCALLLVSKELFILAQGFRLPCSYPGGERLELKEGWSFLQAVGLESPSHDGLHLLMLANAMP